MTVKEQLQELRRLDVEINNKIKELEELRQRSVGVGSFDYSKDRVVTSPSGDAMSNMVSKIIVLDEQINEMIDNYVDKKEKAKLVIKCLHNEKELRVLYLRYIIGLSWRQVAEEMDISHGYMYKLHNRALYNVETIYREQLHQ